MLIKKQRNKQMICFSNKTATGSLSSCIHSYRVYPMLVEDSTTQFWGNVYPILSTFCPMLDNFITKFLLNNWVVPSFTSYCYIIYIYVFIDELCWINQIKIKKINQHWVTLFWECTNRWQTLSYPDLIYLVLARAPNQI